MKAQENECQFSQNDILYMKRSEFYLCFHNSFEIWNLKFIFSDSHKKLFFFGVTTDDLLHL